MHISAKVDYSVRALVALTAAGGGPVAGASLAQSEGLPAKFLEGILAELRRAGIVISQRGADGGYRLARPAREITLADVFRAIDGPLAEVRGERPETMIYDGAAMHLQEVWIAVRASLRTVLEHTTLADVASGHLPPAVMQLSAEPDAWLSHTPPIPEPRLPVGAPRLD
jgi:Rrf2 family protein